MNSFKEGFNKFIKVDVRKAHTKRVDAVEDYVYNQIISNSPKDTGAYQANHHRTAGAPNFDFDPDNRSGREPSPVGEDGFREFYIANGAPYAQALEDGHSQQGELIYARAELSARVKFGI